MQTSIIIWDNFSLHTASGSALLQNKVRVTQNLSENYSEGTIRGTVRLARSGRSLSFVRYGKVMTIDLDDAALARPLGCFDPILLALTPTSMLLVAHVSVVGPSGW